jgi:hypothetical protein
MDSAEGEKVGPRGRAYPASDISIRRFVIPMFEEFKDKSIIELQKVIEEQIVVSWYSFTEARRKVDTWRNTDMHQCMKLAECAEEEILIA